MLKNRQAISVDVSGFTLLEILVVGTLMAGVVFTMAPVFSGKDDQGRCDRTLQMLEEIKKAVIGDPDDPSSARGEDRLAGYVPDMGGLPSLEDVPGGTYAERQPKGLWTPDLDGDGIDDLVRHTMFIDDQDDEHEFVSPDYPDEATAIVSLGWRGPYVEAPPDGVLRDGWGNPFVFEPDTPLAGDLTVKSLGADGIPGGDAVHDADIAVTIRKNQYLADVAGYVAPNSFYDHSSVTIRLCFAPPDTPYDPEIKIQMGQSVPQPRINHLKAQILGVGEDGYFRFSKVPAGRARMLKITEQMELDGETHWALTFYRFSVMPGANWLGTIEMETIY